MRVRVVERVAGLLVTAAALAATIAAPAAAGPPAHPELNPLFAAEWWLRGHTMLVDLSGESRPSDGVDAINAWPSSTGEGVVVPVADTGIDVRTPALAGQLLPARDFLAGKRVTRDPLGHGTHVATLISGTPRNGDGIFGVAPDSLILPLRVARARGDVPVGAAAAALAYASRDQRVRVLNMSWKKELSAELKRALAAATTRTSLLLVSAAGNDARDLATSVELPQTFDSGNDLTVASADMLDNLSWFSNYGKHIEVAAPGERILSAHPNNTLKVDDGTSMAAAIVSGVATLLLARYPTASARQVKQAILASCTPVRALAGRVECGGIVNAPTALSTLAKMLERDEKASSESSQRFSIASTATALGRSTADTPPLLNEVAHVYSLGVGEVRCPSQAEWDVDPHRARFSWGYTNLRHDYSVLPPLICTGALTLANRSRPAWEHAAGVWMLLHEAFHLRHWRHRRNEAKVGCQTIVYFTDAAMRLGATEDEANELYPYALTLYRQTLLLYPWYRDGTCIVPPWILPSPPSGRRALRVAVDPATDELAAAREIATDVDARYPGLRVTETSSTAVIESLTLFDSDEPRVVPAARGVYYAICPNGARCPDPGRGARRATALAPRRLALELAIRTFLETSADLVVISLPTRRSILLVFERDGFDTVGVSQRLAPYPPADASPQLRTVVDPQTLPRLYAPFALWPAASGRDSLLCLAMGQTAVSGATVQQTQTIPGVRPRRSSIGRSEADWEA